MVRKLVIIPTYDERENVLDMVDAVLDQGADIDLLIVDDASPDGTAEVVRERMASAGDRLHLLERRGKLGLGTAYIAGFRFALDHGYDLVCEMDCDFSHDPNDLNRLFDACTDGADVAIGSRYVRGGGFRDWPLHRSILSTGASLYVQLVTWMGVRDATAGFVCYRRSVLETLDLDAIHFIGYAFQIEMKLKAKANGFTLREVPIVFRDRTRGTSKMSKGIISEAIFGVLKLQWQRMTRRDFGRRTNG